MFVYSTFRGCLLPLVRQCSHPCDTAAVVRRYIIAFSRSHLVHIIWTLFHLSSKFMSCIYKMLGLLLGTFIMRDPWVFSIPSLRIKIWRIKHFFWDTEIFKIHIARRHQRASTVFQLPQNMVRFEVGVYQPVITRLKCPKYARGYLLCQKSHGR